MRPRHRAEAVGPPARPLVVAHRGASSRAAEHTLGAYVAAIESGADAVECDVRMTRDGHLVCVHDRTVNRTSDGTGIVSDLDLAALRELDFASWWDGLPESADDLVAGRAGGPGGTSYLAGVEPDRGDDGRVLTLERLLAVIRDANRPVRLFVETKHPTRYGGLVEKELVGLLDRFGWAGRPGPPLTTRHAADLQNRIVVMSFAPTALRRVRLLAPDVPTVLLLDRRLPGLRAGPVPAGVPVVGPGVHVLRADPGFVARAHARGLRVFVWTVNESTDLTFVRSLGVDAVITDRPAETVSALAAADDPAG